MGKTQKDEVNTVELKFSLCDTAYILEDNKIFEVTIKKVMYEQELNNMWSPVVHEKYEVQFVNKHGRGHYESIRLFKTKERIAKRLLEKIY